LQKGKGYEKQRKREEKTLNEKTATRRLTKKMTRVNRKAGDPREREHQGDLQ